MIGRLGASAGFVSACVLGSAVSHPAHLAALALVVGLVVTATLLTTSRSAPATAVLLPTGGVRLVSVANATPRSATSFSSTVNRR